ncbi:hypothetical protein HYT74_01115 [Candidatus Daviesbacteria bacterium]|nr:hypothetical protein [Candidatus Daviesbacteria bacterium]MBI2334530.1 hypothetical protein [Candidatus Daviesbacteria bacterium]MBI3109918.1 hypothetical protein [Candidatus Daviesbacteria bacterium]
MIFKIIVLFFIMMSFVISGTAYATQELNLPDIKITPGSFYYSFKRIWEKGWEKLQFNSTSKIAFYESQLKTRLAELNYVVEKKLLSEVQKSTERFAYTAGILAETLVKENKDQEKTVEEFRKIQIYLEKLRDQYPANSSFWMLVQHDINTLGILSEKLK